MCKTKLSISTVACAIRISETEEKDCAELQMQYMWGLRISADIDTSNSFNIPNAINLSYCLTHHSSLTI